MKSICGGCGLIFTGLSTFDKHRVGEFRKTIYAVNAQGNQTNKVIGLTPSTRRCLTIPEIQALGLMQNERGWWGEPLDEKGRAYFERRAREKVEGTR